MESLHLSKVDGPRIPPPPELLGIGGILSTTKASVKSHSSRQTFRHGGSINRLCLNEILELGYAVHLGMQAIGHVPSLFHNLIRSS